MTTPPAHTPSGRHDSRLHDPRRNRRTGGLLAPFAAAALLLGTLLAAGSCVHHRIIPDNDLAQIFHDAFLTNAYINNERIAIDSLNIYEPIFARYGYSTADVQYTIGNFSKRKSARLGNIVERAIEQLEREGARYDREVAILDTIEQVALRTLTRTVRSDSLLRIRTLADTAQLRIALDVKPGRYEVRFDYEIDSLDRNGTNLQTRMWLERRDSTRTNIYSVLMHRSRKGEVVRTFDADSTHRRLRICPATFLKKPEKPSFTISNLRVRYTPPAAEAVDSLYARQLDIRIFADEFFRHFAPDAAPMPADSL